jgi:UDP-N-acetylglucosamine 2-epimerase (non-hydrolysing)
VVGTRPEAIKLAPVIRALADVDLPSKLIFTGQHPRLDPDEFGLPAPTVDLHCPGEERPHEHVRKVTSALLPLMSGGPDLLIVQGDTSSALGAALAGFAAGVPVAHVEAGLRTHDPQLPWPEEEYRTAIDARADLLFAPTETSAANLEREAVPGEIHVTGNTGIDALLALVANLPPPPERDGPPRLLVTCHRRESWGEGLRSIAAALRQLAAGPVRIDFVLHPNAHVAAAMREELGGRDNIRLIAPCGHRELVESMRAADLILSDSGGIQEEAPALGVPLLVLRDKTERPEAIASGNARLVGTSADGIVSETRRLLDDPVTLAGMSRPSLPFGDGHAAPRIARIVDRWLRDRVAHRR